MRERLDHPTRPPTLQRVVGALLGSVVLLLPMVVRAEGAVVVRSRKIAAYEVALGGLLATLQVPPPIHDLPPSGVIDDALAAKIKAKKPEVLVGIGSKAATALRARFPRTPLVFSMVLSPAKRGLDDATTTGVRLEIPPAEQFRRLGQLLPGLERIGVIYDEKRSGALIKDALVAAREQKLVLVPIKVTSASKVPEAFGRLVGKVDAVWLVPDATVVTAQTFKHMLLVSLRERVPLLVFSTAFVKAGALAGVAPDYRAVGEATGRIVRSILKGEKISAIPVQDPPSTILVNRRSAARLGITIIPGKVPGMAIVE